MLHAHQHPPTHGKLKSNLSVELIVVSASTPYDVWNFKCCLPFNARVSTTLISD